MAQIYLVRHTKVNVPSGICYGTTDVSLASTFAEEYKEVQKQLEGKIFDIVYSSPLIRCTQLAKRIAPDNYITDSCLSELNFGEWEGKTWDEIYQTPYGKEWMERYMDLACPGGESYRDLYKRVEKFIKKLEINKNILIITHAGVIRVCMHILNNIDSFKTFRLDIKYGEVIKI
jgi:alpha-ribazole phosphatase